MQEQPSQRLANAPFMYLVQPAQQQLERDIGLIRDTEQEIRSDIAAMSDDWDKMIKVMHNPDHSTITSKEDVEEMQQRIGTIQVFMEAVQRLLKAVILCRPRQPWQPSVTDDDE